MASQPLRVWVLSDGQPGHYNLSRGIVRALELVRPVDVTWLSVKLRMGLARNLLRGLLNRGYRPASPDLLRVFYRVSRLPQGGCDLLVSAGGKTSFANAWLASVLGVPNIYVGSLRRLSAQLFAVVVTLEPVAGADSNLVVTLPPTAIDQREVESRGAGLRERLGSPAARYWALLIGGNGAGYRYARHDWTALGSVLETLSARHGVRWLVASSPRTGPTAERLLQRSVNRSHVAAEWWYRERDAFSLEGCLGAAERVFVTEDSMTMLTEAICSQRPVFSLRPRHAEPNGRYERAMQRFQSKGFLCRLDLSELLEQPDLLDQQDCRVLTESPSLGLAAQLDARLRLHQL